MVLSDRDIKKLIREKQLVFYPFLSDDQIGPASVDLKLNNVFKTFNIAKHHLLDVRKGLPEGDFMVTHRIKKGEYFILHPNNFVLVNTKEYIKVSDNIVLRVEGKSTLARMGILVHTAGFVDPGYEGTITLEVSNQSDIPVALYPGMYICQVAVENLSSRAEMPYNKRKKSLYSKAKEPLPAKTNNLFENKRKI